MPSHAPHELPSKEKKISNWHESHTGFTYNSAGVSRSTGNSYSFCPGISATVLGATGRSISSALPKSPEYCRPRARLRITKKSPVAKAMASGIPNPTPKAIVCNLFLPLDEACDVGDDVADCARSVGVLEVEDGMMAVREEDDGFEIAVVELEEEFEEDGRAGITTRFSLTGSVVNLSLPVQQ